VRSLLMLFSVVKLSCKERVLRMAILVGAKAGIESVTPRKLALEGLVKFRNTTFSAATTLFRFAATTFDSRFIVGI